MARQSVSYERQSKQVRVHVKTDKTNTGIIPKGKGMVNVPPHIRMVQGKPVLVAGYTYRRK